MLLRQDEKGVGRKGARANRSGPRAPPESVLTTKAIVPTVSENILECLESVTCRANYKMAIPFAGHASNPNGKITEI